MATKGSAREVFGAFAVLGLTSFGGPVAHLGYFREAFVVRRGWLGERAYADLVALCQFLPGPASSQVGMAIGLQRAGYRGMLAAWFAFTLPSALALVAFAYGVTALGADTQAGWILGLKAAAVAVVAHAVLGMARTLAPDKERATIAVAAMAAVLLIPQVWAQVAVIAVAGLIGWWWLRPDTPPDMADTLQVPVRRGVALACLGLFGALLVILPLLSAANATLGMVDSFYRTGSLVFGGGHVVLPLLQAETAGTVSSELFLAGYGAAQAVPGPLFSFAAYLGAVAEPGPGGVGGAAVALVAIFLPSMLLIVGALPFWEHLRRAPHAQRALMGVNAGVVGLLAAALYTPVFTAGIGSAAAMALAAAAFVALSKWQVPAWAVVVAMGVLGHVVL